MVKKHNIIVQGFHLTIPAVDTVKNVATHNYYNYKLFEDFLNDLIQTKNNKIKDGEKYFHLVSIKQSSDADILEGVFHTTRYGQQSDIIDINQDKVVSQLQPAHGVRNVINFVINRKTGVFLIQNDPFRIITRKFLIEFFEDRKALGKKPVNNFNVTCKPLTVSPNNFYTLQTIFDEDFYSQLAKLMNVKAVSVNTKVEKSDVNGALSRLTLRNAGEDEYLDEITDITYTFKNTRRSKGVKQVKQFIQNALDFEKIDTITVSGTGNEKVVFDKIKPQKFKIETEKNKHGVLDQSKIISEMIRIAKDFQI